MTPNSLSIRCLLISLMDLATCNFLKPSEDHTFPLAFEFEKVNTFWYMSYMSLPNLVFFISGTHLCGQCRLLQVIYKYFLKLFHSACS